MGSIAAERITLNEKTLWRGGPDVYKRQTYITKEETKGNCKTVTFAPTEPLSNYLFSFVTGQLEHQEYTEGNRKISAYYRETDS